MAGEFSFDVVSEFDAQELRNALDQVRREIATRFDFKGATAEITQEKDALAILADSELRAKSIRELIETKAVRRSLSLKIFDWGPIEQAGGTVAGAPQEIPGVGTYAGFHDTEGNRLSLLRPLPPA